MTERHLHAGDPGRAPGSGDAGALQEELEAARGELAASRREVERLRAECQDLRRSNESLRGWNHELTSSRAYRLSQSLSKARWALFPSGSLRARAARPIWRALAAGRRLFEWGRRQVRTGWQALMRPYLARRERLRELVARLRGEEIAGQVDVLGEPGLVSVILPVYNQAYLLADSIESVLAQTYEQYELIVLDDGSTDGVEEVFSRYARHPRVRLLTQPNQKLPKALSNAFLVARGELYTWTSADNLMEPAQLERHVQFLRAHPETAMVYSDYLAIDDRGEPLRDWRFRPEDRREPEDPEIHLPRTTEALNSVENNFIGACFMYRGALGRMVGEYDPQPFGVEDYDYWMRLNRLSTIRHLGTDELLYRYRVHDNTLNARAVEIGIPERSEALMRYDRERGASYARPFRILADEENHAWLRQADLGGSQLQPWNGEPWEEGQKVLLIVSSRTACAADPALLARAAGVAVRFAQEPNEVYDSRFVLALPNAAAFAPDRRVAARLALFTERVFDGRPGRPLLSVAMGFANNAAFYRATRSDEALQRVLPRPYRGAEPLHVLIQVQDFLQGGLEKVVLDLVEVLRAEGLRVSLLVLGRQGSDAERARSRGLEILTLGEGEFASEYAQLLERERVDLVNAHHSTRGAALAAEAGLPFVQTVHNTYVWLSDEELRAYRAADRDTSAYVCVSANVARYSDVRLELSVEKLIVLPNGVHAPDRGEREAADDRRRIRAELGCAEGDFVFLDVASIYPPKAQRVSVHALARVREELPNARLVLLGRVMDEGYAQAVRGDVEALGLEEAVVFAGYRPDTEAMYAAADAFLLPSFWEGWSLAVAEAAAAGLPLVLSDVGGARDQVAVCGGEVVAPPFASITELDSKTMGAVIHAVDPGFVERVAEGMERIARGLGGPDPERVAEFDAWRAFARHGRLFEWLAGGGRVAAWRAVER